MIRFLFAFVRLNCIHGKDLFMSNKICNCVEHIANESHARVCVCSCATHIRSAAASLCPKTKTYRLFFTWNIWGLNKTHSSWFSFPIIACNYIVFAANCKWKLHRGEFIEESKDQSMKQKKTLHNNIVSMRKNSIPPKKCA